MSKIFDQDAPYGTVASNGHYPDAAYEQQGALWDVDFNIVLDYSSPAPVVEVPEVEAPAEVVEDAPPAPPAVPPAVPKAPAAKAAAKPIRK